MFSLTLLPALGAEGPLIDAAVAEGVRRGPQRVLVELRLPPGAPPTPGAIAMAQRDILTRLAGTRVSVAGRYATIPLLALEIDAAALAQLAQMGDLVLRVLPDAIRTPSASP